MNDLSFIGFCRHSGFVAACVLIIALAISHAPVWAGTKVSGSAEAVTVEAQDSSIREVLAVLSHDFQVQYQMPSALVGRVTGTYKGSLREVVGRILAGHNFVVVSDPRGKLSVTVLGGVNAPQGFALPGLIRGEVPSHQAQRR